MDDDKKIKDGTYSTRGNKGTFGKIEVKSKSKQRKRLTNHEWGELLGLLKTGRYTQEELSKQYGVSTTAIWQKRKKLESDGGEKVTIGSDMTKEKMVETINGTANSLNKAAAFTLEESGRLINEAKKTTYNRNAIMGKYAEKLLATALRYEGKLANHREEFKAIMDLQNIFEKDLRLKALCLGFKEGEFSNDFEDMPELIVEVMTDDDIEQVKNAQKEDEWMDNDLNLDDVELGEDVIYEVD